MVFFLFFGVNFFSKLKLEILVEFTLGKKLIPDFFVKKWRNSIRKGKRKLLFRITLGNKQASRGEDLERVIKKNLRFFINSKYPTWIIILFGPVRTKSPI